MRPRVMYLRYIAYALLIGGLGWTAVSRAEGVVKSPADVRDYAAFVLPNQLKVLVISDPETDKAAAALDVNVGSSSNPADRQGLAHFLEHMLFLGTEKYPDPGEYQRFISSHGGGHNAYTSAEHTNYYFDIDQGFLQPALDRFGQFFTAPLFTAKYVDREKHAVDSEYQSKRKVDAWRLLDAVKQVMNPKHPSAQFSVGSLSTLEERDNSNIRDELIDFYERHYSANLMTLVVLGKEPVSVLKQWVTEHFSAVRNTDARPLGTDEPLFTDAQLPSRLRVQTVKDNRTMTMTFPIPALAPHYLSKPVFYIANLLGHEGKGSLLSLLKANGWSDGLSAGAGTTYRDSATFRVAMDLTEAGLAHVDDIASLVFQYLRLIERDDIVKWAFEEQQKIAEMGFRFQEQSSPIGYVRTLAHSLQTYPMRDVLRGPYAMENYDPELIKTYLGKLRPDNVLITVSAREVEGAKRSPWFDAPYEVERINDQTVARWRAGPLDERLALPEPNVFLPDDLALKSPRAVTPTPGLINKRPGFELWFQQDTTYKVPRADFYFNVRSKAANDSARHAVLTQLYVKMVNDQLNEFSYPAYLAGLSYNLYKHVRGFSVRLSGYNDKQEELLERIARTIVNPELDAARFALFKAELARSLRNAKQEPPSSQALAEVRSLLMKPYWTEDESVAALSPLSVEDLKRFIPELLGPIDIVALAHGNLHQADAMTLAAVLKSELLAGATPVSVSTAEVLKLDAGDQFVREIDVDHQDSAAIAYFQGVDRSVETRARFALLSQVIGAPFFHDLRTEKQLGYVVYATYLPLMEVPGIGFVVQSPSADPLKLEMHMEDFVAGYAQAVAAMTEKQFGKHKAAVLTKILEKEESLKARSDRYWVEIDQEFYSFDSRTRLARAVMAITKQEFTTFYRNALAGESQKRLVIRSTGSKHKEDLAQDGDESGDVLIRDPSSFKRDREVFSRETPSRNEDAAQRAA